ncbi:MAG: hypothetical protein V7606_1295, partial [Burkholderiales bacterium]
MRPKLLPLLRVLFWGRVDDLPSDPVQPCNAFDQPGGQRVGALFLRYDVERLDDAASQIGMRPNRVMPPVHEDQFSRPKMKKGLAEAKP